MTKAKYITAIGFVLLVSSQLICSLLGVTFNEKIIHTKPVFLLDQITQKPQAKEKFIAFYQQVFKYRNDAYHYLSGNFSLKTPLVKAHQVLQKNAFNINNPIPHEVIYGNEGWMFLGNENSDALSESKGLLAWEKAPLIATRNHLAAMKNWCKKKDIQFYFIIAPNKHSIYGDQLTIKKSPRKTKLEVLATHLKELNINTIDLSILLQEKKKDNQVYHKIDSHWNELGAFWAYEALMNLIKDDFSVIHPLSINDFKLSEAFSARQDLSSLLMDTTKELSVKLNWKVQPQAKAVSKTLEKYKHVLGEKIYNSRYKSNANPLKTVVIGDSFSQGMRPYLRESFGETVFLRYLKFDRFLLDKEKPDIIILEIVERNLDDLIGL